MLLLLIESEGESESESDNNDNNNDTHNDNNNDTNNNDNNNNDNNNCYEYFTFIRPIIIVSFFIITVNLNSLSVHYASL